MRYMPPTFCAALCITMLPITAAAQGLGWSYTVSAGAEYEPTYVGSVTNITEFSFGAEAVYTASPQLQWVLALGGAGVRYRPSENGIVAVSLEFEPGRDDSDDDILSAFPDIEDTWELQAVYLHDVGPLDVGFGFQQDILGKGKGLVGFLGAEYDYDLHDRLTFNSSLVVSVANEEHMKTEVGISPTAAAASGLETYSPSGGFKSATLIVGFDYLITDAVTLYSEISVERYGANIADSPLVASVGDATNTSIEIGLSYTF